MLLPTESLWNIKATKVHDTKKLEKFDGPMMCNMLIWKIG